MKYETKAIIAAASVLVLTQITSPARATTYAATDATGTINLQVAPLYQDQVHTNLVYDASTTPVNQQHAAIVTALAQTAQASTNPLGGGQVFSSVSPLGDQPEGVGSAEAKLQYEVIFSGPADLLVPFSITTNEFAYGSVQGSGYGRAYAIISDENQTFVNSYACWAAGCQFLGNTGSMTNTIFSGSVDTNIPIYVNIDAQVSNYFVGSSYESISAGSDPIFTFDPNLLEENGITFLESPSIVNSSAAVPEPSTWAMMLVGFGLAGYVMRKRPSLRQRRVASISTNP